MPVVKRGLSRSHKRHTRKGKKAQRQVPTQSFKESVELYKVRSPAASGRVLGWLGDHEQGDEQKGRGAC